jgi:hypothetical protein
MKKTIQKPRRRYYINNGLFTPVLGHKMGFLFEYEEIIKDKIKTNKISVIFYSRFIGKVINVDYKNHIITMQSDAMKYTRFMDMNLPEETFECTERLTSTFDIIVDAHSALLTYSYESDKIYVIGADCSVKVLEEIPF